MTLRFVDSFDDRDTASLVDKYTTVGVGASITASGRTGANAMRFQAGGNAIKTLDDQDTWTVGFGLNPGGQSPEIVGFYYNNTAQATIGLNAVGLFYSGTNFATAPIPFSIYSYVEVQVYCDNGAGTIEVRLNEETILNLAAQNTDPAGSGVINNIRFGQSASPVFYYDDLYICDGNGAINNDFLGDQCVILLMPNGAGTPATAEWTSSAGGAAVHTNVDEIPPNEDTDYNYAPSAGLPLKDVWAFDNITIAGTVNGVQVGTYARKDDAGVVSMEHVVRSGGDNNSASFNISDDYIYYLTIWEQDPNGPAVWTVANVNAAEFGYRRSA